MTNDINDLTALQAHIDEINAANSGPCQIADANHFYTLYGICTVVEFEAHMDMETFSDWYKDVNNFRPRGYTLEEARAWMERQVKIAEEDLKRVEAEEARYQEILSEVNSTPTNSTMADALKDLL